jgi:hypothetical protein
MTTTANNAWPDDDDDDADAPDRWDGIPDADGTKHILWHRPAGWEWAECYSVLTSGDCAEALVTGYNRHLGHFIPLAHIIEKPGEPWVYHYAPGALSSD